MTDDIQLTDDQQYALEVVRKKPGMTVEYYTTNGYLELDIQLVYDLGFLIFNGYIKRDPQTGALTAKG